MRVRDTTRCPSRGSVAFLTNSHTAGCTPRQKVQCHPQHTQHNTSKVSLLADSPCPPPSPHTHTPQSALTVKRCGVTPHTRSITLKKKSSCWPPPPPPSPHTHTLQSALTVKRRCVTSPTAYYYTEQGVRPELLAPCD